MPIIKSAKKRAKQAVKRTAHNKEIRTSMKQAVKEVKTAVGVLDAKKIEEKLSKAFSELDKAAKKNVIHKNNAARKKSRLAKLIAKGEKVSTEKKRASKKKSTAKAAKKIASKAAKK